MKNNNKKSLSSACILVIGDEVLSGRTEDKNINFIAKRCDNIGVSVNEVRIIPDDKETINQLTQSLVNKILHKPTINLKKKTQSHDGHIYLKAIRDLFHLDD